jgi:sentrin-specific protease 1
MKPSEKAQERIGATVSNIPITVKSLLRLLPGRLLPDDVIEAFCSLIQRKAINQNVHIFPPLFTYKLMQSGPGSVNKHSRRVNLVSKDMNTLVFIYNPSMHWISICVYMESKSIHIYDSFVDKAKIIQEPQLVIISREKVIHSLMDYIQHAMEVKNTREWTYQYSSCPQQSNGHDCGVHACLQVLCLAFRSVVDYDTEHMDMFRLYILNCLLQNELLTEIQ